ncbi:MAG: hypothetical protein AAI978_00215 [Candidatus Hodgkinia cicadicola]
MLMREFINGVLLGMQSFWPLEWTSAMWSNTKLNTSSGKKQWKTKKRLSRVSRTAYPPKTNNFSHLPTNGTDSIKLVITTAAQ